MMRSMLLGELIQLTNSQLEMVHLLKELPTEQLKNRPLAGSWNALECIEHLTRYGDFYITEITRRLSSDHCKGSPFFKSGWLGNYFAKMMLPGEKMKKIKTFKTMDPIGSRIDISILDRFSDQLQSMLVILQKAGTRDLSRIKTSISISKLIRLRLGDTLRVVVYHNERHMAQVQNALATKAANKAFVP